MLEDFLYKRDIDLALIQEVTNSKITTIRRYVIHQHGAGVAGLTYLQRIAAYLTTYNAYIRDEVHQHNSMESE